MNLAIKGNREKGNKVIELFLMLGGKNKYGLIGIQENYVYFIDKYEEDSIDLLPIDQFSSEFIVFSLEEFKEKFPYKIGDKVKSARINDFVGRIINVRWDNNEEQIIYLVEWDDVTQSKLTYFAKDLQTYEEECYCQVIGNDTSSNSVNTSISLKDEDINETNETIFEFNTQSCDIMNDIIKKI